MPWINGSARCCLHGGTRAFCTSQTILISVTTYVYYQNKYLPFRRKRQRRRGKIQQPALNPIQRRIRIGGLSPPGRPQLCRPQPSSQIRPTNRPWQAHSQDRADSFGKGSRRRGKQEGDSSEPASSSERDACRRGRRIFHLQYIFFLDFVRLHLFL